jgi:hypothetical protein
MTNKINELLYILKNNIENPILCKHCKSKRTKFKDINKGYGDFCSKKCLGDYVHRLKDPKISNFSEEKIKEIILSQDPYMMGLRNENIANIYGNIPKITENVSENLYLFINGLNEPVKCSNEGCNNSPSFISFNSGYSKYCSKECSSDSDERIRKRFETQNKSINIHKCENENCNKLIPTTKVYCTSECYFSDTNKQKIKIEKARLTLSKKGLKFFQSKEMKEKGYSCYNETPERRKQFEEKGYIVPLEHLDDWNTYKRIVSLVTYRQPREKLKDWDKRGRIDEEGTYNLDHKFSIKEGFDNKIPPFIIGNIINLEMIPAIDNYRKGASCSISKEELLNEFYKK